MTDRWLWVVPCVDDLRARTFFGGFRVPPEDVLLVDNTRDGIKRPPKGVERVRTGLNHGCARSWNIGVRKMIAEDRPGLVLASSSLEWGKAGGRDLHDALVDHHDPVMFARPCGWHLVAWAAPVFEKLGFFDERFHPVYFEDNDWLRRVDLGGYGLMNTTELENPHITVDARMGAPNQAVPVVNWTLDLGHLAAYYEAKWGWVNAEYHETPFGLDVPLSWWPGNELAGYQGFPAQVSHE